jgi:hypothetical protein
MDRRVLDAYLCNAVSNLTAPASPRTLAIAPDQTTTSRVMTAGGTPGISRLRTGRPAPAPSRKGEPAPCSIPANAERWCWLEWQAARAARTQSSSPANSRAGSQEHGRRTEQLSIGRENRQYRRAFSSALTDRPAPPVAFLPCWRQQPTPESNRMRERVSERRRAAQLARHYREQENLSIAQISRRLERAEATVRAYLCDPS